MIKNLTGKSDRYESVFFDLDGTITDSGEGCLNGIRYMFERIGYSDYDDERLKGFVGPHTRLHLMREYGFSEEAAANAYLIYREYYDNKGVFENRLYDGIQEVLTNVSKSGKTLYIATSKPEPLALLVIERFGIKGFFSGVFAAQHDAGIFEKTQVLESALKQLKNPPRPVMVGDRDLDITGGKHVGFDTVGVLYGYGDEDELLSAGCDYIVDSPDDLTALLGGTI